MRLNGGYTQTNQILYIQCIYNYTYQHTYNYGPNISTSLLVTTWAVGSSVIASVVSILQHHLIITKLHLAWR